MLEGYDLFIFKSCLTRNNRLVSAETAANVQSYTYENTTAFVSEIWLNTLDMQWKHISVIIALSDGSVVVIHITGCPDLNLLISICGAK